MGSIEEEDLTGSLDFEFFDPGDHKPENVTFNKVYNKPPPGRRPVSAGLNNKVCYENSAFNNGTNNKNNYEQQHESPDKTEMNGYCPKDSDFLMNGIGKNGLYCRDPPRNEEDCDKNGFISEDEDENDLQSGLDVSISDDTEDEDGERDIYEKNDGLLVDELTDDEGDDEEGDDSMGYSGSERSERVFKRVVGLKLVKSPKKVDQNRQNPLRIVLPNIHHHHNRNNKHGSASCSSEESSSSSSPSSDESDLSSLDNDDDECLSSDEDDDDGLKSTDEETGNNTNKSLGKNGPTPPKSILCKNGLSLPERYFLKHKSKRNNCSNNKKGTEDQNCNNNIDEEDDFSSASEMTDVSPLASSAENSPTMTRKSKPLNLKSPENKIISICACEGARKDSGSTPLTQNGRKNGFSCSNNNKKSANPGMDMNLILKAVEEISKEDDEKWRRRCSSKVSSSSSSSSPIRKRNNNNRTNLSYSNERARQIERENERLLSQLLKLSSSSKSLNKVGGGGNNKKLPLKSKVSHSAINRQREMRRIDKENEAFLRRLQSARVSNGLSRDDQLEEYNSKHLKCPRSKSTRNNGSPLKRPFTATSSSGRNSIISLGTTDSNNSPNGLSKRNSYHHQSTPAVNRPEWVSKW